MSLAVMINHTKKTTHEFGMKRQLANWISLTFFLISFTKFVRQFALWITQHLGWYMNGKYTSTFRYMVTLWSLDGRSRNWLAGDYCGELHTRSIYLHFRLIYGGEIVNVVISNFAYSTILRHCDGWCSHYAFCISYNFTALRLLM